MSIDVRHVMLLADLMTFKVNFILCVGANSFVISEALLHRVQLITVTLWPLRPVSNMVETSNYF